MSRTFTTPLGIGLVAMAFGLAGSTGAQTNDARDAEFKAAVVYNFSRFATWAPSRFSDAAAPVVLCVNPSERLLVALVRLDGRPVGNRRLQVRTTRTFGSGCHLAFISVADAGQAQVGALQRQGVLTVSDVPNFSRFGVIGLVTVGRQVRFEINTAAARESGVALSSQLMRLAIVVR